MKWVTCKEKKGKKIKQSQNMKKFYISSVFLAFSLKIQQAISDLRFLPKRLKGMAENRESLKLLS